MAPIAKWRPPSARDALVASGDLAGEENPNLTCPSCGRARPADMLRDLRGTPAAVRQHFDHHAFACDACTELRALVGVVSRHELARHLGAPPEVLTHLAGR